MKKIVKNYSYQIGIIFIKATFNNTILTLTDFFGNAVGRASGGSCGFKGSRKSTPFAAKQAGTKIEIMAKNCHFQKIWIIISGPGPGKESAIRSLQAFRRHTNVIKDETNIPHNGCRPPKRRRI